MSSNFEEAHEVYELFVPPATFFMASLVFGNKAFLHLPVHVIQMTLCASPLIVYSLAMLAGIEVPNHRAAIEGRDVSSGVKLKNILCD